MHYTPHTDSDREEMLRRIGVRGIEELLVDIPASLRNTEFSLPEGMSEHELLKHMTVLASANRPLSELTSFLGAGAYEHLIPAAVEYLLARPEFSTCYTPYQPEASQGTLTALFEYQTMICRLTGMPVANASLYDGASACAEAAILALRAQGKNRVALARSLNPFYARTVATYLKGLGTEIVEIPYTEGGQVDTGCLADIAGTVSCVIVQSPNFFGVIEDMKAIGEIIHDTDALFVASVNPVSLGVLAPPGECGADIAVGDVQVFGNTLSFGGPYAGFFAVAAALMRKIPGRVCGMTQDREGRRGFVLTLQTREQHIRREKATSNICTNEALCTLASCVYLSLLGRQGIEELARLNVQKAHYACEVLSAIDGVTPYFSGPFFNEFVITLDSAIPLDALEERMLKQGILPGLRLGRFFSDLERCLLVCVTEARTREEIDRFAAALKQILKENL
ncbi:MAG: aminomethyl-transferring glycine dehydrogenase subunit GcvPA [Candidatus Omnitrophica bacterium]|nr:aminomethyl-transferring glycine dehydrogenase subunit GcvPA [Candidatus Omnitrophota bacterium]